MPLRTCLASSESNSTATALEYIVVKVSQLAAIPPLLHENRPTPAAVQRVFCGRPNRPAKRQSAGDILPPFRATCPASARTPVAPPACERAAASQCGLVDN